MQNDASNISGARKLEVVDGTWQLRLNYGPGINGTGLSTDFLSNSAGNLQILPVTGKVGINAPSDPTATIDVFGDARIRDVQVEVPDALFVGVQASGASNPEDLKVRRLDFTGNPAQVLLGNGTWGMLPTPPPPGGPTIFANNGVSKLFNTIQLGEPYNSFQTVPLLNNREVFLDMYDLLFTGKGNIGIGQTFPDVPTEKLDVFGNARFRTVPVQGGQSLILGLQQGLTANDIELSRLVMPNDATQVLLGNGTWGSIPTLGTSTVLGAENGASMSTFNTSKVAFGQDLNQAGNPGQLLNDREIPMNNNNIVFTDNNAIGSIGENRIGIGTSSPQARMHIQVNTSIVETAPYAPTALQVNNNQINNSSNTGSNIDVSGGADNTGSIINVDGGQNTLGLAVGAKNGSNRNHAIEAYAQSLNGTQANENYGVISSARLGILNVGGFFEAYSDNQATNENYGVKAVATGVSDYNYGVYGAADFLPNNFAGYFAGAVHVQGSLTIPGGTVTASDIQFKTNVQDLTGAMSLINQLEPRTYDLDTTNYADFNFEADQQMGLVAQEVEQVLPTLVSNHIRPAQYDSLGMETAPEITYKGVEYEELIPLLIAGMQEQDDRIDSLTTLNGSITNYNDSLVQAVSDLNDRLTLLENCLSNILPALCNANQMAVQQTPEEVQEQLRAAINVNLSDRNAIVLNQNVPNPFAESTIIKFSIPATVQKAQIHFYDGQGKLINSVDIVERGNGQLNVFANDLSTGVYTYSLVADGQIVSTKRMVKE